MKLIFKKTKWPFGSLVLEECFIESVSDKVNIFNLFESVLDEKNDETSQ